MPQEVVGKSSPGPPTTPPHKDKKQRQNSCLPDHVFRWFPLPTPLPDPLRFARCYPAAGGMCRFQNSWTWRQLHLWQRLYPTRSHKGRPDNTFPGGSRPSPRYLSFLIFVFFVGGGCFFWGGFFFWGGGRVGAEWEFPLSLAK